MGETRVKRDCGNCIYGRVHKKDKDRCLKHWSLVGTSGGMYDYDPCRFTPKRKPELKTVIRKKPVAPKPEKPQTLQEINKKISDLLKNRMDLFGKIEAIAGDYNINTIYSHNPARDYHITKEFREFIGINKNEAKLLTVKWINSDNRRMLEGLTGGEWKNLKRFYELVLDNHEKFLIKDRMEYLCKIAPCYSDKGKTIRKEIALKICEGCGTENFLEAQYCRSCGKSQ